MSFCNIYLGKYLIQETSFWILGLALLWQCAIVKFLLQNLHDAESANLAGWENPDKPNLESHLESFTSICYTSYYKRGVWQWPKAWTFFLQRLFGVLNGDLNCQQRKTTCHSLQPATCHKKYLLHLYTHTLPPTQSLPFFWVSFSSYLSHSVTLSLPCSLSFLYCIL